MINIGLGLLLAIAGFVFGWLVAYGQKRHEWKDIAEGWERTAYRWQAIAEEYKQQVLESCK